jgi:hypothetical protein
MWSPEDSSVPATEHLIRLPPFRRPPLAPAAKTPFPTPAPAASPTLVDVLLRGSARHM